MKLPPISSPTARVRITNVALLRVGGFERVRKYTHQGEKKLTEVVVRHMTATEPVSRRMPTSSTSTRTA